MRSIVALLLLCSTCLSAELPNADKTPGAANPHLTKGVICSSSFRTKPYRNVSPVTARQVYLSYGKKKSAKCCEVDHLISLELGGSNSIKNLWPQDWAEAKVKDRLENELHRQVCIGRVTLEEAQREISTDWWTAYKKYLY